LKTLAVARSKSQIMKGSLFFFILLLLLLASAAQAALPGAPQYLPSVMNRNLIHISQDPVREKRERTPAQQKIDTQLLYAIYRERGEAEAKGVPAGELPVKYDNKGRAIVSIRARVTKALLAKIEKLGGKIVSARTSTAEPYGEWTSRVPSSFRSSSRKPATL
jgi:hypothetical protein